MLGHERDDLVSGFPGRQLLALLQDLVVLGGVRAVRVGVRMGLLEGGYWLGVEVATLGIRL